MRKMIFHELPLVNRILMATTTSQVLRRFNAQQNMVIACTLSEDEVQTLRDREMGIRARGSDPSDPDRAAPEAGGNIGSYNDFWFDRGNDGFTIDGQYRTSILTYPEDGRMPPRTPEGQVKADAAPKFAWPERDGAWWLETGDQPYDGPENKT